MTERPDLGSDALETKDVAILQLRAMLERFIDGDDRSSRAADQIEDFILANLRGTALDDDLIEDLALYEPGGGEFLVDEAHLVRLFRWVVDSVIDRRSPLHDAAIANDSGRAERLLDEGTDPNVRDRRGFTPLHLAAQEWSSDVAELLLVRGAAVDAPNADGNTPLFVAVLNSRGRPELVGLLRSHGADPKLPNKSGQTPFGLARLIGNYGVERFFADLPDPTEASGDPT